MKENIKSTGDLTVFCPESEELMNNYKFDEKHKSFVLYKDQKGSIDLLTDEEAGILLKTIFSYVLNDKNIDLEFDGNRVLKQAFTPIQEMLQRDEIKYIATCEKRKNSSNIRWEKEKELYNCMQLHTNYADRERDSDIERDRDSDSDIDRDSILSSSKEQDINYEVFKTLYHLYPNKEDTDISEAFNQYATLLKKEVLLK